MKTPSYICTNINSIFDEADMNTVDLKIYNWMSFLMSYVNNKA